MYLSYDSCIQRLKISGNQIKGFAMRRFILLAGVLAATAAMATDFMSMSTEELVALRGSVAPEEIEAFKAELQSRLQSLTPDERKALLSKSSTATGTKTQTKTQNRTRTRTQTRTQSRAMDALNGNMGSGTGCAGGGHGGGGHGGGGHDGGGHGGGSGR